jgi:hypothetical protein
VKTAVKTAKEICERAERATIRAGDLITKSQKLRVQTVRLKKPVRRTIKKRRAKK